MKRKSLTSFLLFITLAFSLTGLPSAHAAILGSTCKTLNSTESVSGVLYICDDQMSGPVKTIWKLNVAKMSIGKNKAWTIALLNNISWDLGHWVSRTPDIPGAAALYVSDYPCLIYVMSTKQGASNGYQYLTEHGYSGPYLVILSKGWVVNDISASQNCYQYFSMVYGGMRLQN